jgi:hypothetical protein
VLLVVIAVAALAVPSSAAEPAAPRPPEEYDVIIEYQIDAFRNERLKQYAEMLKYLTSVGFKPAPPKEDDDPEDRTQTKLLGTIAPANVRKLLGERHVRTVFVIAKGVKPPQDGEKPVRVHLQLASGLNAELQRLLAEQTRTVLKSIDFQEATGYDHRGQTYLMGNIPTKRLLNLLDLRQLPVGKEQPAPFKSTTALRVAEVLPAMDLVKPLPPVPVVPAKEAKIAPDLRALAADKQEAAKPRRMELILLLAPAATSHDWQRALLEAVPGMQIEGRVGALVTFVARTDQALALAEMPLVTGVRLPRVAKPRLQPTSGGKEDNPREALRASGLEQIASLDNRGKRTRIAVVDSDFQNYQRLVKTGRLPANTRCIDLTAARSRELDPEPFSGSWAEALEAMGSLPNIGPQISNLALLTGQLTHPNPNALGQGARCALAVAQAAPAAELVLVRVDPAAPHMIQEVARAINGESVESEALDQRSADLSEESHALERRRETLLAERKLLLDSQLPFEEFEVKWANYSKRQDALDRDEAAHSGRMLRYLGLLKDLRGLKGVRVVSSPFVWHEGHPLDGVSPISRYFDDRPFRAALWLQSGGSVRGQVWSGLFRDADGNGVMEFAAPSKRLPDKRWTPELNFLEWKPESGKPSADLPAGARIRITLQWREAHDPEFLRAGEDVYREPLANLRLLLLRQRDPAGEKLPADDMELVAQSEKLPLRLHNEAKSATYEHVLEYTVPAAGRYAIMVQGQAPKSTRPADKVTLPAMRKVGELRPRVFVDTLSGGGRANLQDFTSDRGTR